MIHSADAGHQYFPGSSHHFELTNNIINYANNQKMHYVSKARIFVAATIYGRGRIKQSYAEMTVSPN